MDKPAPAHRAALSKKDYRKLTGFDGDWRDTWWSDDFLAMMAKRWDLDQVRSVLDVGCGPGFVMDALAVRWPGVERTGVEPSPLESERPNIYRGTLEDHRGLRADLVCALDVMEHTDDDVAFLRALAQRGPRIVLRIPLDVSVVDALTGRTRAHRENLGHRFAYTRRRALERVSSAGLEIIDDAYHAIPYPGRLAGLRAWGALRWPHLTYRLLGGASLMVLARAPV